MWRAVSWCDVTSKATVAATAPPPSRPPSVSTRVSRGRKPSGSAGPNRVRAQSGGRGDGPSAGSQNAWLETRVRTWLVGLCRCIELLGKKRSNQHRKKSSKFSFPAEQTRRVFCSGGGRENILEEKYCEAVLKPKTSKRCSNKRCRGRWKVGKWSKVIGRDILLYHSKA